MLFVVDLNVLVLGAGNQVDYSSMILNQDFTLLSDTTNENEIKTISRNVVTRIKSGNVLFSNIVSFLNFEFSLILKANQEFPCLKLFFFNMIQINNINR